MKKELKFKDLKHGDRTIVLLVNGQRRKAKVVCGFCDECAVHKEVACSKYYSIQTNDISRNVAGCLSLCLSEHKEHLRYEVNCKTRRMIVRYNKKQRNKLNYGK